MRHIINEGVGRAVKILKSSILLFKNGFCFLELCIRRFLALQFQDTCRLMNAHRQLCGTKGCEENVITSDRQALSEIGVRRVR